MSGWIAVLLASSGALLAAAGGFFFGQWWQSRKRAVLDARAERQISEALEKILSRLQAEDDMARAVDPLAQAGRSALTSILTRIQEHGGYSAVVLSDDAGLVLAATGKEEVAELLAVAAASFGNTSERVHGRRQTILETEADRRWTLHRYFTVEEGKLCLSATRHGGSARPEALDGALGAFQRVLTARVDSSAA